MSKGITSLLAKLRGLFGEELSKTEMDQILRNRLGDTGVSIVALITREADLEVLLRLAFEHKWTVHLANTYDAAWDLARENKARIFLYDRERKGAEWRDVIQRMASSPQLIYAILVSKVADDYLWNEVIRHGGHDLLAAPLREADVLRAVRLACSWNDSMRVPPRLIK